MTDEVGVWEPPSASSHTRQPCNTSPLTTLAVLA